MSRFKDGIAFGWTKHPILMPFLTGWLLSTLSVLFLIPTHIVQLGLIIFGTMLIIHRIDRWAKARIAQMYVDLKESGRFGEMKEILMEEARKMAKQAKTRKLMTYCHECECQIFHDDSYFVDGPGNTYCIVCCDDLEEQEKRKNDRSCMCHHCGAKFAPWKIICNGESLGEATGCCITCADLGAPTE